MNRIKTMVALVAATLLSTAIYAQTPNEVIEKFNQAAELVNGKDYQGAIVVLNEVVEMGLEAGPDAMETVNQAQKLLPVCYFRVGLANAQANNLDEAVTYFEKAAELGELYGDTKTTRDASGMISRVYTVMAATAFNDKDYAKAADIFAKGYEANPTDTDLALNLAMSYAEMGETEKAYEVYNQVIALEDRHSKYQDAANAAREKVAYYRMLDASAALESRDYTGGIEILEGILETDPSNELANMMLIQTATNLKNWDMVIARGDAAAQAQTTDEARSNAYFLLGAAYQNKENKAKAIENYRKVTVGPNVTTAKAQITALNN